MTVYLGQVLCPARHCLVGVGYEGHAGTRPDTAAAERMLRAWLRVALDAGVQPHCALCGAPAETWVYEVRRARYATLAEARPELEALEADQQRTAAFLKATGRAHDSPIPPHRN